MYCRKCGTKIPEGNRFCEECGSPVPGPKVQAEDNAPGKKTGILTDDPKKRRKRIAMIAAFVVVIGVCIGALTGYFTHESNAEYQAKLTSAQKYVSEGNVDEAIKTFEEAIEINPKKENAYLELADLYITHERYYEAVSTLQLGYENTGNKEAFQEPIKVAEQDLDGSWKSAYRQVLEDNRTGILAYQDREYEHVEGTTALCDLNDDGIPELMFFKGHDEFSNFELDVYTFTEGKAKQVDYSYKPATPNMPDASAFADQMAGAGTTYLIFRQKSTPGLVIYATNADETIFVDLALYDMDKKGGLSEKDCVGYTFSFYNDDHSESYDHIDFDKAQYYRSKNSTDKAEFDKVYEQVLKDMGDVIFYRDGGASHDDARELWEKGSSSQVLSMSYENMLTKLQVQKTEKSNEGSAGDNELFKELSGKTFRFASGAGAWDTVIEIESDGSFHGQYGDSDMGVTGDGYPNGTRYFCKFSGKFKDPKKTGDLAYTIALDGNIKLENTVGDTEIIDGVLYEYSQPYGLENLNSGDTLIVNQPGQDMNTMKDYTSWFMMTEWYEDGMTTCPVYTILNPGMKYAFIMV